MFSQVYNFFSNIQLKIEDTFPCVLAYIQRLKKSLNDNLKRIFQNYEEYKKIFQIKVLMLLMLLKRVLSLLILFIIIRF